MALIQDYVDLVLGHLTQNGLEMRVRTNFDDWISLIRTAAARSFINPTFDPAHSILSPSNSFWLEVTRGRETVACIANRLFETDDYYDLMRTWRLWFDRMPVLGMRRVQFVLPPGMPAIRGRIGHHGALWVHPTVRKLGLSTWLPRLTRALSLRHFKVDWHCGIVKQSLADHGLPIAGYGYTHCVPCIKGYYPAYGIDLDMAMTYIDRADMLRLVEADVRHAGVTRPPIGDWAYPKVHQLAAE